MIVIKIQLDNKKTETLTKIRIEIVCTSNPANEDNAGKVSADKSPTFIVSSKFESSVRATTMDPCKRILRNHLSILKKNISKSREWGGNFIGCALVQHDFWWRSFVVSSRCKTLSLGLADCFQNNWLGTFGQCVTEKLRCSCNWISHLCRKKWRNCSDLVDESTNLEVEIP